MIRDPSDGTVKEMPVDQPAQKSAAATQKPNDTSDLIASTTSGLPFGSTKPEHIERLERSRAKLKRYHETGVWDDET